MSVADHVGVPADASFPPIFLLALRFAGAAMLWLICCPAARVGWTWPAVRRSLHAGTPLAAGLIVQHLGLDRTSESTSAFLTSLTILFVPILTTVVLCKPPSGVLWVGVAVATAGICLMTAATPCGFGVGEAMGIACALLFSVYILAVNAVSVIEPPSRLVAGQFVLVAVVCIVASALLPGREALEPGKLLLLLSVKSIWLNLLLLTIFTTAGAFGLLTYFQPLLDPTQAAIIYLCEPVIATLYAAAAAHHWPTMLGMIGAGMILSANIVAELLTGRATSVTRTPIVLD
jgi:drug/metabolite transporter (DMT)-like permease